MHESRFATSCLLSCTHVQGSRRATLQGELVDGEPMFPGESDIDQLYRIQQLQGPLIVEHRLLFEMHPAHQGITFPITEAQTLARRYSGKFSSVELEFLSGLLHLDPKRRFDGRNCLLHPYIRDLTAADAELQHLLEYEPV